jgi:hypothetical protein
LYFSLFSDNSLFLPKRCLVLFANEKLFLQAMLL